MTRARRGLALLGLAAVFFWLRLTHLAALPVFLDEAIHVDWALRIAQTGRLLGITDGGRYLPIWLYSLVLPHTAAPLLAARLLSAIFGFGAMLGLIALGRVLYRSGAGFVAALLYLVLPSALLYDRMALVESLLVGVVLFALLTSAIWADRGRLGWALVTGALIGVAADTKLYGALAALAPLLAMAIRPGVRRRDLVPQVYMIGGVALVVMLPAFLELTPTLRFVSENVWVFRSGPHGQASLARNIASAAAWTFDALTPLGCALSLLSGVHALRRRDAADGLLLGFWLLWTVFFVLTGGRDWFPRYLLPAQVPILLFTARHTELLAGELAGRLRRPRLRFWLPAGLVLAVALPSLPKDVALLVRPEDAALSGIDRWQYIEDWPSGYRLDDLLAALDAEAGRVGPLLVLRDAGSGPLFESLNLLLREKPHPALEFVDVDFRKPALLAALRRLRADARPTLVALDQPVGHPLVLQLDGRALAPAVAVLVKPGRFRQLEIYCLAGACAAPPVSRVDRRSLDLDDLGLEPLSRVPPGVDSPGALEEARRCAAEAGAASLEACRRALAAGLSWPRASEAYYSLGRIFTALGRYPEAARALRESVRLLPQDTGLSLAFVDTLEALGSYDEATEVLDDVLRVDPDSAPGLARLGWNQAMRGRRVDAAGSLERSLELVPGTAAVRSDLGAVLVLLDRPDAAARELRRAVTLDVQSLRALLNRAIAVDREVDLRAHGGP